MAHETNRSIRMSMTQNQLGIWFECMEAEEDRSYDLSYLHELGTKSEEEMLRLARALERTVLAHPGLLARVASEEGIPALEMETHPAFRVDIENAASREDVMERITRPLARGGRRVCPIDLRGPLCVFRLFQTPEGAFLFSNVHHIISDGSSLVTFFADLSRAYETDTTPEAETCTMADFCRMEEEARKGPRLAEEAQWYREHFTPDELSRFPGAPDQNQSLGDFRHVSIPLRTDPGRISEACGRYGVSKNTLFNGAFGYLLSIWNHSEEATFSTLFHGRTDPRFARTSMMAVRTLPVYVRVERETTVGEYLAALQRQSDGVRQRSVYSALDLSGSFGWNFNLFFAYQGSLNGRELVLDGKPAPCTDLRIQENGIDFSFEVEKGPDGFRAEVGYPHSALSEETVREIVAQFDHVLLDMTGKEYLRDLEILTEEQKQEVIRGSAGPLLEMDVTRTVPSLISGQAARNPESLALNDGREEMTYGEMERRANLLARELIRAGVRPNEFVGILLERSVLFPVCVQAIHKAGAAYLPLDPEYPPERLNYMMENAHVSTLITARGLLSDRQAEGAIRVEKCLFPEELDFSGDAPAVDLSTPEGNAYMIYTSGSTGLPKGVVLHHAGLLNLTESLIRMLELNTADRVAIHCSFCFDGSVDQLFPTLASGASLHIMPSEIRKDIDAIIAFLRDHRITGTGFTTPLAVLIVRRGDPDVRFMTIGGEKLAGVVSDRVLYFNQYGPTECTDVVTSYTMERGREYDEIPIGEPMPNLWCFLVDRFGHLLPPGIAGEICVAGIQVGRGYWNLPEKTAEVYGDCPFVERDHWGRKVRMYHTGDLGKRGEDGMLYCIGRIDSQIKLNGFRIELGEVENAAMKYPGIIQAAAAVKNKSLCLYYTSDVPLEAKDITEFLSRTLAEYMIPASVTRLKAIPETPNGKTDRKALPEPELTIRKTAYTAPRSEPERKICSAFERVLGLKTGTVGIHDDFFAIGGDSLRAMQVMGDADLEGLSARMIFRGKTAAAIAEELAELKMENLEEYEREARTMRLPVTSAQELMFADLEEEPDSIMFNLPGFFRMNGVEDADRLARAVDLAAAAHPGLCTAFEHDGEGNILQYIRPDYPGRTTVTEVTPEELEALKGTLIKPYDPFGGPLFRSRVFRCEGKVYLFVDMLHMVSDGASLDALYRDIARAYRGEELSRDYIYSYIRREAETRGTPAFEKARKYFADLLGDRNWCRLPTFDHDVRDPACGKMSAEDIMPLECMAQAERRLGYSRNVIAMTATMLALREYCGESRVSVDYVNNNRMEKYIRNSVGLVFKTLPLAADLSRYADRAGLLQEINRQEIESFVNSVADYTAKEDLEAEDAIAVNYVSNLGSGDSMEGLGAKEIPLDTEEEETMGGHMDLYIKEEKGSVSLEVDYTKHVYEPQSIRRFLDLIVRFLKELTELPESAG